MVDGFSYLCICSKLSWHNRLVPTNGHSYVHYVFTSAYYILFVEEEVDGKAFLKLREDDFKDMGFKIGTRRNLQELQEKEKGKLQESQEKEKVHIWLKGYTYCTHRN